ncbi:MAG TPA: HAMP domain-containing protein, partial [Terracidiphilus sp.]
MLNVTQRLILGCAALAGLTLWLALALRGPLASGGHHTLAILLPVAAIALAVLTVVAVLTPLRMLARDARKIAQGNLDHRSTWTGRDSAGVIAAEINRLAVRLRELRESEAGRRQMEFQLADAVLQSIFEPVIVTDSKGHLLKVNQAAAELLGPSATDRMA